MILQVLERNKGWKLVLGEREVALALHTPAFSALDKYVPEGVAGIVQVTPSGAYKAHVWSNVGYKPRGTQRVRGALVKLVTKWARETELEPGYDYELSHRFGTPVYGPHVEQDADSAGKYPWFPLESVFTAKRIRCHVHLECADSRKMGEACARWPS